MDNLILTSKEVKEAYHNAWGAKNPHNAGLTAIAEAQTTRIINWLKENGEPIFDDWTHQCGWQIQGEAWKSLLGKRE